MAEFIDITNLDGTGTTLGIPPAGYSYRQVWFQGMQYVTSGFMHNSINGVFYLRTYTYTDPSPLIEKKAFNYFGRKLN